MLTQQTLQFLADLKVNNNKPWFDENKKRYTAAKENFQQLVGAVLTELAGFDTSLAHLEVKNCVFRINRDVRFSTDKSPYKTNFGASFSAGGKKIATAGYYMHIMPGESFFGGGFYMPEAEDLKRIRQEIDYNFSEFQGIITEPNFVKQYGTLSVPEGMKLARPPKGYTPDNEAIEFLKLKGFIATKSFTDVEVTNKQWVAKVVSAAKALQPLIDFLNRR
ncbi:MAG: DUF2461 domain-containing protein [Bacteroidetes bacterium]|nr:MAG: DUF2461 domain-containing protein [Bacteroidota bacterium]TAE69629.1 MAG: DUF2461 domain-containing protein [Bacteroidota bacterium]TAF94154.1 MAG: DUF2461 domain-containing protein [Bacteroidota bacterium]